MQRVKFLSLAGLLLSIFPCASAQENEHRTAGSIVVQGTVPLAGSGDVGGAPRAASPITATPMAPPSHPLSRVGNVSGATLPLSLNEAIRLAIENNNSIEVVRGDVRFAEASLLALGGVYDPVFSVTSQISRFGQPEFTALNGLNPFGLVNGTAVEVRAFVTKLFRAGGQQKFFFNNLREPGISALSQFSPYVSASFGMTFTQPLLRDRSIDHNRRNMRVQQKLLQQSDADFRRLTTEVIAGVQRAYLDLVFALHEQQNRSANLDLAREQLRLTEMHIAAGDVAPLERAEVRTELAKREDELLLAVRNVSAGENRLKELILRDPLAPEWAAQIIPTDEPVFAPQPVNLAEALEAARSNRSELGRLRLQQDVNDIDVRYFRDQTRPRIDFQATLGATQLGVASVIPTNSAPTSDANPLFSRGAGVVPFLPGEPNALTSPFARNIALGVSIQFPLRNRTAEAQLAGAHIQREQLAAAMRAEEQAVQAAVRNAVQDVETARHRVSTARSARDNAELQLNGERRLYQVGRSTMFLLFQRENQVANARHSELRAETNYNKALADLQCATGTTLRANNVTVESPTRSNDYVNELASKSQGQKTIAYAGGAGSELNHKSRAGKSRTTPKTQTNVARATSFDSKDALLTGSNVEAITESKDRSNIEKANLAAKTAGDPANDEMPLVIEKSGRSQKTAGGSRQAVSFNSDPTHSYNTLGITYGETGRYKDAVKAFKRAISLDPENPSSFSNLGLSYYRMGKFKEAIEAYKQAINLAPEDGVVHVNLALAYSALGRYDDAVESFKQAINLKPDDADAHLNLGLMYVAYGNKSMALDQHKVLMTIAPDQAKKLYDEIHVKGMPTNPASLVSGFNLKSNN